MFIARFLPQLAGWPEDQKLLGRQRLLALWTFFTQPFDFARGRAAVFQELTDLLSSDEAETWEEGEWREVVESLRRGSPKELDLVTGAVQRRFSGRSEELVRLMRALYSVQEENSSRLAQLASNSNHRHIIRLKKCNR